MTTILVVDDLAVFREPIAMALQQHGYDAVCAGNGLEAMEILRSREVELILLDLAMPVVDGIEFLRRWRSERRVRGVKVMLLTEMAQRGCVLQAVELGIDGYLLKSAFSVEELLRRVHVMLEGVSAPTGDHTAANEMNHAGAPAAADSEATSVADLKPLRSKTQTLAALKHAAEPQAMSSAVEGLRDLAEPDTVSIEEVAEVVRKDPAVALKILKLANSSIYARGEPVESVEKAVMRIGLSRLRQVLLDISVIESFADAGGGIIDVVAFWEHAVATAVIAAGLARQVDVCPQYAFTLGLLHDVGRLILADTLGPDYRTVCAVAQRLGAPLEVVEARMLRLDHAEALDPLLLQWKFPRDLIDPLVLHHQTPDALRRLPKKRFAAVGVLMVANRVAQAMLIGGSGNDALHRTDMICRRLHIGADAVGRVVGGARAETNDLMLAMLADLPTTRGPSRRDRIRTRAGVDRHPLYVGADTDVNTLRLFLDEIRDEMSVPDVIVVDAGEGKRRVELLAGLEAVERSEGVSGLPVLIIGSAARTLDPSEALAGRTVREADWPLDLGHLADTLNELATMKKAPLRPETVARERKESMHARR